VFVSSSGQVIRDNIANPKQGECKIKKKIINMQLRLTFSTAEKISIMNIFDQQPSVL
jgi:hypothetical protein